MSIVSLGALRAVDSWRGQQGDPLWCCNIFMQPIARSALIVLGALYGFYVIWVLLGTCWFLFAQAEPQCLLRDSSHFWYYFFWLWYCYFWMTVYTCALMLSSLNAADGYSPLAEYEYFAPSLSEPLIIRSGLAQETISAFPEHSMLEAECNDHCSICVDEYRRGERVRVLTCSHIFHSECIDPWLEHHSCCPICRRSFNAEEPNDHNQNS